MEVQQSEEQGDIPDKKPSSAYWPQDFDTQISQVVRKVFQDEDGHLWFASQSGGFKLDGDSLQLITGITDETGRDVTIRDITEGPDGTIWFAHTGGLSRLHENEVANYHESDGLLNDDVWTITTDFEGQIWIGTYAGLCLFDGDQFLPFKLPKGKKDPSLGVSSPEMVHSILCDTRGELWFSTNAGLFKYSNNELSDMTAEFKIETDFVNEVMEDRQGRYWISTKEGLYMVEESEVSNMTAEFSELGKGIGAIEEDAEGRIWFVFDQHRLFSYHKGQLKEFEKSKENPGPVIYDIFKDAQDRMWFVGFGGAFRLEDGRLVNVSKEGPW